MERFLEIELGVGALVGGLAYWDSGSLSIAMIAAAAAMACWCWLAIGSMLLRKAP